MPNPKLGFKILRFVFSFLSKGSLIISTREMSNGSNMPVPFNQAPFHINEFHEHFLSAATQLCLIVFNLNGVSEEFTNQVFIVLIYLGPSPSDQTV